MKSETAGSVLIVDDERLVARALDRQLAAEGYSTRTAGTIAGALEQVAAATPELILLDLQLPDGNGLDLLARLRVQYPEVAVIIMTGHGSVTDAVRAMKMEASHYITKPINFEDLTLAIETALSNNRLVQRAADERQRNEERFGFERLVAESDVMQRVIEAARLAASSPASTVLLLGESGTGKGILARAIHHASHRSSQPFLTVTCSAIPEALLEAEMFGHERGAFTGADKRRRGVFESAHEGTVFLDEIGDMPAALQAKLLGVVEERAFARVGGTQRQRVDVRIVAATHRDLQERVEKGEFREDLFYRLEVIRIVLPALRDRPDDVLPLANSFVQEFNREFARTVEGLDDAASDYLRTREWRGNIRELRNVIERAMLFTKGDVLTVRDVAPDEGYRPRGTSSASFVLPPDGIDISAVERDLIRQAMEKAGNNQSRAAALLGLTRDQIRYRLDKMGLLPSSRGKKNGGGDDDRASR